MTGPLRLFYNSAPKNTVHLPCVLFFAAIQPWTTIHGLAKAASGKAKTNEQSPGSRPGIALVPDFTWGSWRRSRSAERRLDPRGRRPELRGEGPPVLPPSPGARSGSADSGAPL